MNSFLAGLVSALPLSVLGVTAMMIWGRQLPGALKASGADMSMSDSQVYLLFLGTFALAPLMFGVLSAVVYNWVKDPMLFRGIALGLAIVMSALALISHTPMAFPKIAANFAVAIAFGLLLPWLAK